MSQKHNLANKEGYGDINVIAIHSPYQVSSLRNGKIIKWRYAFIVPMTFSSNWIRNKNIAILENFLFSATNNKDMYSLWTKIRPASMDF